MGSDDDSNIIFGGEASEKLQKYATIGDQLIADMEIGGTRTAFVSLSEYFHINETDSKMNEFTPRSTAPPTHLGRTKKPSITVSHWQKHCMEPAYVRAMQLL